MASATIAHPNALSASAEQYGRLALVWSDLKSPTFAYANARIAAHTAYLAIGRGSGHKAKVIPFFDTRKLREN